MEVSAFPGLSVHVLLRVPGPMWPRMGKGQGGGLLPTFCKVAFLPFLPVPSFMTLVTVPLPLHGLLSWPCLLVTVVVQPRT